MIPYEQMSDNEIAYILSTHKRHGESDEWLTYMVRPVVVLALTAIGVFYNPKDTKGLDTYSRIIVLLVGGGIGTLLFLLEFFALKRHVKFKSIPTPYTKDRNYQLISDIYHDNPDGTMEKFPQYITFDYENSALVWGQHVILVPLDNEILINSHTSHLASRRTYRSFWRNTLNVSRFKKQLLLRIE